MKLCLSVYEHSLQEPSSFHVEMRFAETDLLLDDQQILQRLLKPALLRILACFEEDLPKDPEHALRMLEDLGGPLRSFETYRSRAARAL